MTKWKNIGYRLRTDIRDIGYRHQMSVILISCEIHIYRNLTLIIQYSLLTLTD